MKNVLLVSLLAAVAAVSIAGDTWVVLISGMNGWDGYPTESSMCKLYHIAKGYNIPDEHIITFFADDVAYNESNRFPGQIFNEPYHQGGDNVNVYEGIVKDYIRRDATANNLLKVLTSDRPSGGSGKVLRSTESDNVLIFFMGGGWDEGAIKMPTGEKFDHTQLSFALNKMRTNKMFKKLMMFVDAPHSAAMIDQIEGLDSMDNVYFGSSDLEQGGRGSKCMQDYTINNYVAMCYAHAFTLSVTREVGITMEKLFENLFDGTSWPCQYGDSKMKEMTFADFMKNTDSGKLSADFHICNDTSCNEYACDCFAECLKQGYEKKKCGYYCCNTWPGCYH